MILEKRRSWLLWLASWVVWRIRPRRALKMAEFSHTEAGSGLDMLAAAEETRDPVLRRKFFQHALDEQRHARLFATRATALSTTRSRARAVLDDANYIRTHGIRPAESLFAQLGELRFMAFVWVAELRGARQFDVYSELLADDPESVRMFQEIAKDERFHIAYSRRELDLHARRAGSWAVWKAVALTRLRRLADAWLRACRTFGELMASLWLVAVYFVVVGPFALVARKAERLVGGFVAPEQAEVDVKAFALDQA